MKNKLFISFVLLTLFCSTFLTFGCNAKKASVNAVLLVEFQDSETPFSKKDEDLLNEAFITGETSLKNFIEKNSNGKKTVDSRIIGKVKIDKPIDYFMPKYEYSATEKGYVIVNELGYDNRLFDEEGVARTSGKPSAERFFREQEFLYLATASFSGDLKGLEIETLTVIPSKLNRSIYRDTLFYPHQTRNYTGELSALSKVYYTEGVEGAIRQVKLADKSINSYILIPYAIISDGENVSTATLCHEYMHSLGAPDLYSYDGNNVVSVGEFDLMGEHDLKSPNLSLSYTRYKMDWLEEGVNVLPIKNSGTYTLYPTESGNGGVYAYKITTPKYYENGECFYIEYRKSSEGGFANLSSSGLIVYRVNEENGYIGQSGEKTNVWKGNQYGDFEIYIFRFWREIFGVKEERSEITTGGICYATIGDKFGYSSFGNTAGKENAIAYSDGENSQITITFNKYNDDGSVEFIVDLPKNENYLQSDFEGIKRQTGNRNVLYFGKGRENQTAYIVCSNKRIKNPTAEKLLSGKYGKPLVLDTAFLKADLSKNDGLEQFVYLFYGDDGKYSKVQEYYVQGIKNLQFGAVIAVACCVGIIIPTAFMSAVKYLTKLRRKKYGK